MGSALVLNPTCPWSLYHTVYTLPPVASSIYRFTPTPKVECSHFNASDYSYNSAVEWQIYISTRTHQVDYTTPPPCVYYSSLSFSPTVHEEERLAISIFQE